MTGLRAGAGGVLVPLFAVQFLSWGAMFCLWVYALPVVTAILTTSGVARAEGSLALIVVSGCFASYALLATGLAFVLPGLVARFGAGSVHGVALLIAAAGMACLGATHVSVLLAPAFVAIAIGWAAMGNIPYGIAAAAAPAGRGAHTLRLFGFSTVLPQVVVSLGLAIGASWLFGGAIGRVMLLGAAMMATGGILALVLRKRFDVPFEAW